MKLIDRKISSYARNMLVEPVYSYVWRNVNFRVRDRIWCQLRVHICEATQHNMWNRIEYVTKHIASKTINI
jgi:hypothetical protein